MPVSKRSCCTGLQRVVPRLILIVAYIFYLLFGGLVFSMIEGPRYEQLVAEEEYDVDMAREMLIQAYGNSTSDINRDEVIAKLKTLVYAAEHPGEMKDSHNLTVVIGEEWTFGNAMLFCMTTISTIGYGHLVPHTFIGAFLCIVYSSIGIPLTVLLLADLGRLSAISVMKTFNWCAKKFCRCGKKRGLEQQNNIRRIPQDPTGAPGGSSGIQTNGETENNRELDLAEVTLSPNEEASSERLNGADNQHADEPVVEVLDCKHQREMDDDELLNDVPIFLPPIIFWSYIIVSAPGFGMIEGWSFPESLYFLYISVTTIGFGDIVPKTSVGLVFAWMGLIVTAMCVTLSYRKIIKVASWVLDFLDSLVSRKRIRQRDARYSNIAI